jgi:hypothetical protein
MVPLAFALPHTATRSGGYRGIFKSSSNSKKVVPKSLYIRTTRRSFQVNLKCLYF